MRAEANPFPMDTDYAPTLGISNRERVLENRCQRLQRRCRVLEFTLLLIAAGAFLAMTSMSWRLAALAVWVVIMSGVFVGSLCWAAKRGDEMMGIGDSQH
mgnify:CR=1 FL=1